MAGMEPECLCPPSPLRRGGPGGEVWGVERQPKTSPPNPRSEAERGNKTRQPFRLAPARRNRYHTASEGFTGGPVMKWKVWLCAAVAVAILSGGALVIFNYVNAKPPRTEISTPESRKAGPSDVDRAAACVSAIREIGPRCSATAGTKHE